MIVYSQNNDGWLMFARTLQEEPAMRRKWFHGAKVAEADIAANV